MGAAGGQEQDHVQDVDTLAGGRDNVLANRPCYKRLLLAGVGQVAAAGP